MKLSERTLNIFTELKSINSSLKLFEYVDSDNLDTFYNAMYSERTLSSYAENHTDSEIATLVNVYYKTKWDNLIDGYVTTIEQLLNYGTSETNERKRELGRTSTDTTINTVSAFNNEDFTNNDKSDSTGTNDENETITVTTNRKSARNVNIIWNYLLRTNVISDIIEDVNSIVTLSIF